MTTYYITHTDRGGERHQIGGAWEADTPQAAIAAMLAAADAEDDGRYIAHAVTDSSDLI